MTARATTTNAPGEMTLASSATPVWVDRDRDVRPSNADESEALDA